MPNNAYEKKTLTKAGFRHTFYTPLLNFSLTTNENFDTYSYENVGNLGMVYSKEVNTEDKVRFNTPLILKAAKLLLIRHVYATSILTEVEIEAYVKNGWKVVNQAPWDRKGHLSTQLYNNSKDANIDNLDINKLVGKTESKETKKILDGLAKEGESNIFTDAALGGARANIGFGEIRLEPGVINNIVGERLGRNAPPPPPPDARINVGAFEEARRRMAVQWDFGALEPRVVINDLVPEPIAAAPANQIFEGQ